MNFLANFFPNWVLFSAWILLFLILSVCLIYLKKNRIPYQSMFIATLLLIILWSIHISFHNGEQAGMTYHLLGAVLISLMLGFPAALWIFTLSSILYTLIFQDVDHLSAVGISVLCTGLPAITLTWLNLKITQKYLPHHLFIYIFCNAFFTAVFSILLVGVISLSILSVFNVFPTQTIWSRMFPVFLLLMWADGFISGLIIAICVAFAPNLLHTYSDELYLPKKQSLI